MLTAKYISNCTARDIDELKTAILFYDEVEIVNNVLYQIEPVKDRQPNEEGYTIGKIVGIDQLVTQEYLSHIELLLEEGVVKVVSGEQKSKDELWGKIEEIVNGILNTDLNILFEEKNVIYDETGKKISSEVNLSSESKAIHQEFIGPLEVGSDIDLGFIREYYSSQLSSLLLHISRGEQCVTASDLLNKLIKNNSNNPEFDKIYRTIENAGINSNLAMDAVRLATPNISSFPFEEVLEIRYRAKDELAQFRNELETLQFNLLENYTLAEIHTRSSEIVKHKINPSLVDIKRKIEDANLKLPKIVLNEFKDPKSYTPMIGSVIGALPIYISTLLSLGLISASIAYEYILSRKDIRANGMYYLIKIGNELKK